MRRSRLGERGQLSGATCQNHSAIHKKHCGKGADPATANRLKVHAFKHRDHDKDGKVSPPKGYFRL
jgi:hypothetical protein